jgi:anti-anti-sigma factor
LETFSQTHPVTNIGTTAPENQKACEKIVMILDGEYDLACKGHLRSDLQRLTNVQDVVVDFTDVTYIDSTAVVELLRMHRIRESKGYKGETIVVQNPNIKKLFTLLNLQQVFSLVNDLGHVVEKNEEPIGLDYTARHASCGHHASPRTAKT